VTSLDHWNVPRRIRISDGTRNAFMMSGDTGAAERDFIKAAAQEAGKKTPEALLRLSMIAQLRHRHQDAISLATQVLLSTNNPRMCATL